MDCDRQEFGCKAMSEIPSLDGFDEDSRSKGNQRRGLGRQFKNINIVGQAKQSTVAFFRAPAYFGALKPKVSIDLELRRGEKKNDMAGL